MNPSRYQLPQHVSNDRLRARRDTLALERPDFEWKRDEVKGPDDKKGEPGLPFRLLPPRPRDLRSDVEFPLSKRVKLFESKQRMKINGLAARLRGMFRGPARRGDYYEAMFPLMSGPEAVMDQWREDAEFARQRLNGVNPMRLHACRERLPGEIWEAANQAMAAQQAAGSSGARPLSIDDALNQGWLFQTRYDELSDPYVQRHVVKGVHLAAPTCLFWRDHTGTLMPLAIQLRPRGAPGQNPVFTPTDGRAWLMARTHAQCADAHVHEATVHLLETHLVGEAIAMSMYRELHLDHPLRQLLEPHYFGNLAINDVARNNLLSKTGPIQRAMAAGVAGSYHAARIAYHGWSFKRASLRTNLQERGVLCEERLPRYYYRADALRVHDAIAHFVRGILRLWYRNDEDVVQDEELRRFVEAVGSDKGGDVPGFPLMFEKELEDGYDAESAFDRLAKLVTDLIFRAGPQHAAVNNGQFDAYGWIPNAPGMVRWPLPEERPLSDGSPSEDDFWRALPRGGPAIAQMGMVWTLSEPTRRTLMHAGESPAFQPDLCPEADAIIASFRRRLQTISDDIRARNERLVVPYTYLDPVNISRSTDI
jgi:arachidonate 15-lipoxygenase